MRSSRRFLKFLCIDNAKFFALVSKTINFQNLPLFKINLSNLQITFWFLKQFGKKTDSFTDGTLFSIFFEGIELTLALYIFLHNVIRLYDLKFTKFTFTLPEILIPE